MSLAPEFDIEEELNNRADKRRAFLQQCGWQDAAVSPVAEDCASRRYLRLTKDGGRTAVLLESLPDTHPHATPGHKLRDHVRIGNMLNGIGLNTPDIYDADEPNGYLLLEDFGDLTFKNAMAGGEPAEKLYGLATDVLVHIRETGVPDIGLLDYTDMHMYADKRNVLDWYMPALTGEPPSDAIIADFESVWKSIERDLPPIPQIFLHVDYHFENLMWLPERDGLARCGILDFQQAVTGPQPYDLANLLGDARITVPGELRDAMVERYCAGMSAADREAFIHWFKVLGAQFHCRVIGLFVRMLVRDGKPWYLQHIPRLARYLNEELQDPALKPLRDWFAANDIVFEEKIPESLTSRTA